jgi:hypothetical protein
MWNGVVREEEDVDQKYNFQLEGIISEIYGT